MKMIIHIAVTLPALVSPPPTVFASCLTIRHLLPRQMPYLVILAPGNVTSTGFRLSPAIRTQTHFPLVNFIPTKFDLLPMHTRKFLQKQKGRRIAMANVGPILGSTNPLVRPPLTEEPKVMSLTLRKK
jgi:hypothetical protein